MVNTVFEHINSTPDHIEFTVKVAMVPAPPLRQLQPSINDNVSVTPIDNVRTQMAPLIQPSHVLVHVPSLRSDQKILGTVK